MEKSKNKRWPGREHLSELRRHAEKLVGTSARDITKMSGNNIQKLVHELEVHQIELELQNEELRRAQFELIESASLFSDLYDFAPVGYTTLDEKGRIIEMNLTLATMLGVERNQLTGKTIFNLVADTSEDDCYLHLQAVFRSDTKQVCEVYLKKKQGGLLAARLESAIKHSVTTEAPRCRTAVIDITATVKARRELQELNEELESQVRERTSQLLRNESEFQALADNVPALFSYIDRDLRYRYANRRYEEFWQLPAPMILGKSVAELLGPESYEEVRPHLEKVLRGEVVIYDADYNPPDGPHTMHVRCIPDYGDNGKVQGFFALLVDITELKHSQEALRGSEQQFYAVVNLVPDLLWRYDAGGLATWCNHRWLEYSGQSEREALGFGWADAIHPEDRPASLLAFRNGVKSGGPFRTEQRIRQADGSYRWFLLQVRPAPPAPDRAGKILQWFGAATDIDEQRSALAARLLEAQEEERRRVAYELHDDIGQRIVALEMEASHLASLLRKTATPSRQVLESMRTQIKSVADDIRNASHRLHPSILTDFGLVAALQTLVSEFQRSGARVSMNLCEPSSQLPPNVSLALYRIAQEALQNAAKHASGAQVDVRLNEINNELVLTVEDCGSGFDIEDIKGNAGLGLLSMRERARQINGALLIRRRPDNGTQLTVRVPRESTVVRQ